MYDENDRMRAQRPNERNVKKTTHTAPQHITQRALEKKTSEKCILN